ncbi:MAG: hypothetical protein WC047_02110 [Kiritimatiellales bacterium]
METILTALILLAATAAFAGTNAQSAGSATNVVTYTNANGDVKIKKASEKSDAYTGATRKTKKQK